jgi:hypothetical protein
VAGGWVGDLPAGEAAQQILGRPVSAIATERTRGFNRNIGLECCMGAHVC